MSYETPPRGSGGRHWRDDTPRGGNRRVASRTGRERFAAPAYVEPHPSLTDMEPPMNHRPPDRVGMDTRRIIIERPDQPSRRELVVARETAERDEALAYLQGEMADLQRSAYRWLRAACMTVVAVGLYLLGSWCLPSIGQWLGW